MPSLAENGLKSLKGGRTVREGALMSGTAAADLERDGGGLLRGLERESAAQASSAPGEASPIPKCAVGALYSAIGVRSRNAPTQ